MSQQPIMSRKTFESINFIQFWLTLAAVLIGFYWFFGLASVPSLSMYPTLDVGTMFLYEIVSGDELSYDDIAVFFPEGGSSIQINHGLDAIFWGHIKKETSYVKRVVGLPGDVLEVRDGLLWRNGVPVHSDYQAEPMLDEMAPYTVPEGHLFCMGDNRNDSLDSRHYGAFPMNLFFGRAVFVLKRPAF